jgi:hypothetical protein
MQTNCIGCGKEMDIEAGEIPECRFCVRNEEDW